MRSPSLIENWDSKGMAFWAASELLFPGCRFEWMLLLEFWSSCAARLQPRLATDLSGPFWVLSSTRKAEASLARAFELPQDSTWLEMCFLRRGRKLNLNCLPQPLPISCHRIFLSKGVDSNIVIALWLALSWPIVSQLVPTGARRVIIQLAEVALSTT